MTRCNVRTINANKKFSLAAKGIANQIRGFPGQSRRVCQLLPRQEVIVIATLLAITVCGIFGQSTVSPRFAVVSIKANSQRGLDAQGLGTVGALPNGQLIAERVALRYFIQTAYGVKPFQISGGPGWTDSTHYDIEARADGSFSANQMRLMMQTLLEDRFKLKIRRETKEFPVYELTVADSGPKLQRPRDGSCVATEPNAMPKTPPPGSTPPCGRILMMITQSGASMQGGKSSMTELAGTLSKILGRTVIDKTGLTGLFDVHLEFANDEALAGLPRPAGPGGASTPAPSAGPPTSPSIFSAINKHLGLNLKSATGPVEVLFIEHVERPSEN